MSDLTKINGTHLSRLAYVYLRQSSAAQVAHNRESTARQYALSGFTPKKAGDHSTRSASLPTFTEPMCSARPWVSAGLIVYFAI